MLTLSLLDALLSLSVVFALGIGGGFALDALIERHRRGR